MSVPTLDTATAITLTLPNGAFTVWDNDRGEGRGHGPVRETYSRQWNEQGAVWHPMSLWRDRVAIAIGMLGGSFIAGGSPSYIPPAIYPYNSAWTCSKIEVSGVGVASQDSFGRIQFPHAQLAVYYTVPEFFDTSTLVGELELDFSSTAVNLDPIQPTFKYTDGLGTHQVPASQTPSFRITTMMASLKLFNRGSLDPALFLNSVDCVNNATFQGMAAGKVMFRGAKSDRMLSSSGQLQYTTTLIFEAHPQGWNKIYVPSGWKTYTDQAGNPPYASIDFTPLLA